MQYVLFVFSSRDGAMRLYDYCMSRRIAASVVNTPRELGASCGISIRIGTKDKWYVGRGVTKLPTYVGTYLVTQTIMGRTITKIYE
ncbi:MAG: DUF3343 domain-containing protein [Clostridia bacterium]|nr:DUF3343 domain-containing protein [Clostridia bacterium]